MRMSEWFLMRFTFIIFFLCFTPFNLIIAQEQLPKIVKRVASSVVVIQPMTKKVNLLPREVVFSSMKMVMLSPIGM